MAVLVLVLENKANNEDEDDYDMRPLRMEP